MPSRIFSVLKLAILLAALLGGGIGIAWVTEILTDASAKDYLVKSLGVIGVFTVVMLIVASLGGGPSGKK